MKKIYLLTILFLILAIFLTGCGGLVTPTKILSADVIITWWDQSHFEYYGWFNPEVHYKITNTGNVDIDYYKVWFTAYCVDGSSYEDWTNGVDVNVGYYGLDSTYIDVPKKEVFSIVVTDWELIHHSW
ncbi:hypothetical protein ES705_47510 [subsurface metagenome]